MGAENFHVTRGETDVATAFTEATEQARYDHGHAGYTGTIAEKGDYVVYQPPVGKTTDEVLKALEESWDGTRPDWLPQHVVDAYDDKWGPAVAIPEPGRGWHFVGYASS